MSSTEAMATCAIVNPAALMALVAALVVFVYLLARKH